MESELFVIQAGAQVGVRRQGMQFRHRRDQELATLEEVASPGF